MKYEIRDAGDVRQYFFQVPNMVDDMGLDVHSFRLYCHLKRVAGEAGACWQSTDTLASACKMSKGMIASCKNVLREAGLIEVNTKPTKHGGRDLHLITIMDVWERNRLYNVQKTPSSPHELASSPHELKNSNSNKNLDTAPDGAERTGEELDLQDGERNEELPMPMLEAPKPTKPIALYPGDVRQYVELVAALLHCPVPVASARGKMRPDPFWIKGARELAAACGEVGTAAVEQVYREWEAERVRRGREPYALTSPKSFVNVCRAMAGRMIARAAESIAIEVDGTGGFYG